MTKTTIKTLTTPAGTYGLACEPWSVGEIYAIAADWAQASSPVLSYGPDGWIQTPRQVSDYRHSSRAALADLLREAIQMGGDEPDAEEIEGMLDDATEIADKLDVAALAEELSSCDWAHEEK